MNILLYDQDKTLHTSLQEMGYATFPCAQLHQLTDHAQFMDFDAIILVARTSHQGFVDAIHEVRKLGIRSPCVFVSPELDTQERTLLFKRGVDGMTTPLSGGVHLPELQAILHSFIARYRRLEGEKLTFGNTVVDLGAQQISVHGEWFHCTYREFQILELLCTRHVVHSKARMIDYMYADRDAPSEKIINVFVCKLRHRLRLAGAEITLQCVWGQGYQMVIVPPGETRFHEPDNTWDKEKIIDAPMREKIIEFIAQGTTRFAPLSLLFPGLHVNSVRNTIYNLRTLIVTKRLGKFCEYSLSDHGREYALHKGWIKGEAGVDTSVPM